MSFPTKLAGRVATLAIAAASVLALQGPAAADALTITPNGNLLTVNGDGANDAINLSVTGAQPVIAVNGQATTVPAGANTEIVVEAGAGNDDVIAGALAAADYKSLVADGGEGTDTLIGGEGTDTLNGGGENDALIGGKGTDVVNGGSGNDVMEWNNGDGNDQNLGGEGTDESVFNGASVAPNNADNISVAPLAGGGTLIHRTAPTNIEVAVSTDTEKIALNGLAGDDTLAGANGDAGLVALTLSGGEGNDTLTGGDGKDVLSGDQGNDRLFARDGQPDVVNGGADVDSAQTDQRTLDQISEVENVDATEDKAKETGNGDTVALLPSLGKVRVAGSGKHLIARIPVACPAGELNGCNTTLSVQTAKGHRRVLGTETINLAAGTKTTATIRLSPRGAALAVHGRLAVRIQTKTMDAAGNTASRTVSTTLRVPRR
jgi:Ca2+-binding RTX toxin-like protein